MFIRLFSSILVLLILVSCDHASVKPSCSSTWLLIAGRYEGPSSIHPFLYRALVPLDWIRQEPSPLESIADTTHPICEFYIQESEKIIRITLHTFPHIRGQGSIPPQAKIARWKNQFEELNLLTTQLQTQSRGGFNGLFFEETGLLKGDLQHVMGWSMQLVPIYADLLSQSSKPLDQMKCADYTIKASGPPDLMHKHRPALFGFAQSFELIDELPMPL